MRLSVPCTGDSNQAGSAVEVRTATNLEAEAAGKGTFYIATWSKMLGMAYYSMFG